VKRILVKKGTTVGLANGILIADGKKIYSAENLKVGLFK
jgi:3-hydroxyacyl-[acyl-carrier protein] dehydratase/trans-2-decenoyl-[acyl-carrier protein] isomerase